MILDGHLMCPKHEAHYRAWEDIPPETVTKIMNAQQGVTFVQVGTPTVKRVNEALSRRYEDSRKLQLQSLRESIDWCKTTLNCGAPQPGQRKIIASLGHACGCP